MSTLTQLFGEGKDLNALQMSLRALVIFIIALILIRLAGMKTFGKNAAFDNIIIITLGAMLSRAIAGVSPFLPVVCASLMLVLVHRCVSWLVVRNHGFGKIIKGQPVTLFANGELLQEKLDKSLLSKHDLEEAVRQQLNTDNFDKVDRAILERKPVSRPSILECLASIGCCKHSLKLRE